MGGACLRPSAVTETPHVEKQEPLESEDADACEQPVQLPPLPLLDQPSTPPGVHGGLTAIGSDIEQKRDILEASLGSKPASASGTSAHDLTLTLTGEVSVIEKKGVESVKWKSSGWSSSGEVKTLAPELGLTRGTGVLNFPLDDSLKSSGLLESLTHRTLQEEKEEADQDKREEADQEKYKPSPCASPSALKNLRSFLEEAQTPDVSLESPNLFGALSPKTLCSDKEDSGKALLNATFLSQTSVTMSGAGQRQIPVNTFVPQSEHLSSQDRRDIFDRSKKIGGKAGAEELHSKLPPLYWGVSQRQLRDFSCRVKLAGVVNRTPAHFKPYDQCRFDTAGPNMHQVNEQFIKACTNDEAKQIPWASYALQQNHEKGLECNLYISHAWDEGTYEFCEIVLGAWPDSCTGAYICSLANPQNLNIGELIGSPAQSPFYRVLASCPRDMLVVSNSNTPVYARLWCCYEAYCALQINQSLVPKEADGSRKDVLELSDESTIRIKIVGNPLHLISAENSGRLRAKAAALMQELRLQEKECMAGRVADLSFSVESSRAQLLQLVMQIDLDINNAQCSLDHDARSIWKDIGAGKDRVNLMIKQHLYYAFARSMDQQNHS